MYGHCDCRALKCDSILTATDTQEGGRGWADKSGVTQGPLAHPYGEFSYYMPQTGKLGAG